jgi:hypothetical protein
MSTTTEAPGRRFDATDTSLDQYEKGLEIATEIMAMTRKLEREGGLFWQIDAIRIHDILEWSLALERKN